MKHYSKIVALLMAALMVLLVGCTPTSSDSNADYQYDPNAAVELTGTFELQIFTGGYGSEVWEEIIADFEEAYPDLDVVAYLDSNVNKQMQPRWIQGNPPDFVYLAGSNIPTLTYMDEGKLLDLTSFLDQATIYGTDDLMKDRIKSDMLSTYKGATYRLPIVLSAYGMWYDQAYMEEHGLTMPTNFDELKTFVETTKAKGLDTIIYPGTSSHYLTSGLIFPALATYGQEYFDAITSAESVDAFKDPRLLDVLTRFEEIADMGAYSEGTVALNHIQSQIQWLNHKAVLIPNGLWLENEMKSDIPEGFKMRYNPGVMQNADQEQTIVVTTSNIGVASDGDNKEAALEFIRFMYQDKYMKRFAQVTGSPIATDVDLSDTELSDSAIYAQSVMNDEKYTIVHEELLWGSVDAVFHDCVNQIVLGDMTAQQAVDTIVEAVEKKIAGL